MRFPQEHSTSYSQALALQARDFLIAICEPKRRPEFLHEYSLDKNALFAAASMGMTADLILRALQKLSKTPVPKTVRNFVLQCTTGYGKVKLVLERSRYFVESAYPAVLKLLALHPTIAAARVLPSATEADKHGFLTASAHEEHQESLGVRGIIKVGSGAAGDRRAWAADTADGLLSSRMTGEVADDDKGDEEETVSKVTLDPTERVDEDEYSDGRGEDDSEEEEAFAASLSALRAVTGRAHAWSAQQTKAVASSGHSIAGDDLAVGAVRIDTHTSKRGRQVAVRGKQNLSGLDLSSSDDEEPAQTKKGGTPQEDEDVVIELAESGGAAALGEDVEDEDDDFELVDEAELSEGGVDRDSDYDDDLAIDEGELEPTPKVPRRKSSAPSAHARRKEAMAAADPLALLPVAAQSTWKSMQRKAASQAMKPLKGAAARRVLRFEVAQDSVEDVRRVSLSLEPPYPMMQEYDFRADVHGVDKLDIALRQPELLRPYQAKSLAKMYGNGRARSGIIVLPCGAGKTLVGIAAVCTMKKSALVFCPNSNSVDQWIGQFKAFTTVPPGRLIKLTAKHKEKLPPPGEGCIVLTTYHMIAAGGKRAANTAALLQDIQSREWGLSLLDEVHTAVADKFSRVLKLRSHCRLGLTATLVREDGRDRDLSYLIGPKLYEANWMDLTKRGYLANVQVVEVWCPMVPRFYREYLAEGSAVKQKALAIMNPTKCFVLHRLLEKHCARGETFRANPCHVPRRLSLRPLSPAFTFAPCPAQLATKSLCSVSLSLLWSCTLSALGTLSSLAAPLTATEHTSLLLFERAMM